MPEYSNENRGVLFNEQVKNKENSPDWTGKLDVEGKEYRIAAWERTTKTGQPILSLAISEPRNVTDTQSGYQQAKAKADEIRAKQDVVEEVDGDEDMKSLMDSIPF
jgi:uncharacterized protein (DUF736 family)